MDIGNYTSSDVAKLILRDPVSFEVLEQDGEEMWIELHGADSQEFNKFMHEIRRELILTERTRAKNGMPDEFDYTERQTIEMLAKMTVNWRIFWKGEFPAFSPERAKELYTEHRWLREQADRFVHNRINFMKASS